MPRVTASDRPALSRPAARPRARKAAVQQDRISQRTLFLRRVKRSLKPGLWFFGVCTIIAGASALLRTHPAAPALPTVTPAGFGLASLAADAGLRLTNIEIHGAPAADESLIRDAIGLKPGAPSLGISLPAIKARVAALGPVQTVQVERAWPGTLIITVSERAAFAIWQTSANPAAFALIDKSGNIIAGQDALAARQRQPNLLLVAGADAPANTAALQTALAAQPAVLAKVAAAERIDGLRWNLTLKNQTVVKLPAGNELASLAQLAQLQTSMQLLDRPVEVIDLRQPGRLIIRPYPAAADNNSGSHT